MGVFRYSLTSSTVTSILFSPRAALWTHRLARLLLSTAAPVHNLPPHRRPLLDKLPTIISPHRPLLLQPLHTPPQPQHPILKHPTTTIGQCFMSTIGVSTQIQHNPPLTLLPFTH